MIECKRCQLRLVKKIRGHWFDQFGFETCVDPVMGRTHHVADLTTMMEDLDRMETI